MTLQGLTDLATAAMPLIGATAVFASIVASVANNVVRSVISGGGKVPPVILTIISLINVAALNLDKANQFVKMALGKETVSTGGVIAAAGTATPGDAPAANPPAVIVPPAPAAPTEPPKA